MNAASQGWLRLASVGVLLAALTPLGGQEPSEPIKFRRVYVPEADLDQQIRGLLPLKRVEFERRIGRAAELTQGEPSPVGKAHIQQATYTARLEGDVLAGSVELDVQHGGSSPELLVLDPCNLALFDASWFQTPPRPARLGSGPGNQLLCLVPEAGRLELHWRLAGQRDPQQALTFHWKLLPSPISRLQFDLPGDLQLQADSGLIVESDEGTAPGRRNWIVDAGGADHLLLQITERRAAPQPQQLLLVEETTTVNVHQAGFDVQTTLDLNLLHQELQELELVLDEPLELLQARMGEQSLALTAAATSGASRVIVHFPTAVSGRVALNLSGTAAWTGERRAVPRFHLPEAVWQQGQATVTAPASLQLQAAVGSGGSQLGFTPASQAHPLDQWQFRLQLPEAFVEIAKADAQPQLFEFSGTSLDFQATQVQATLVAEFSALGAPRFDLEGRIPRAWIVDAVEVQPAEMLEDRSLVTRGAGPHVLRLALRRPIAQGRPLVVIVRAHRRRPSSDQLLDGNYWNLGRFANVRDSRRLVQIRVSDPASQISLLGDESLKRLDAAPLPPPELRLLDSPAAPLIFEHDRDADTLRIRLAAASPLYRAEIHARAEVERDQMRQSFVLQIEPEESAIETLLARFSPPPPEPLRWSLVGEDSRELTVVRVSAEAALDEAIFEIKLQRPRRSPFVIQADCAEPLGSGVAVSLPSLPTASSQAGLAELHALSFSQLAIEARELRSIPPPDRRPAALATLRAAYRYQPGRAAGLTVTPLPMGDLGLAWIESRQVTSRISADGSGDHEARFILHNRGHLEFVFRLPPSADNLRIAIDGSPLDTRSVRRKSDEIAVPIAPGIPSVVVRLSYHSPPAPLAWRPWDRLAVPIPQPHLPLLESQWQVQLAPGLALAGSPGLRRIERPQSRELRSPNMLEGELLPGWVRYDVVQRTGPVAELHVFRPRAIALGGWCLALVVAGLLLRTGGNRVVFVLLALTIAAASLGLRAEWMPLVHGAVWGLLLGAGGALLAPRQPCRSTVVWPARSQGSTARLAVSRIILGWLALSLAFAFSKESQSQEAGQLNPPAVWRRVVIPVDRERQPVGEYVFVEPELYDALLRSTDETEPRLPKWLLQSAVYRIVPQTNDGKELAVARVEAKIELETFADNIALALDFERRQLHLAEGGAQLDGGPGLAQWLPDGRLEIAVPTAGKHRLELAFIPAGRPVDEGFLLELAIPRIANTIVQPVGELKSSVVEGMADRAEAVRLGPVSRLTLRAPPAGATSVAADVEAEQLVLWKVRPGSVVAEARFRLRPLDGMLQKLAIDFDPRLRVLPAAGESPVVRSWIADGSGMNTLHLVLARPADSETMVPVSFLWPDSPRTGTLELPPIKLRSVRLKRNWAAIELGGGLTWKKPPVTRPGDPAPAEFAADWGDPALVAVAVDRSQMTSPEFVVEMVKAQPQAQEEIDCSISLKAVHVSSRIRLEGPLEQAFALRLRATGGLRITKITARGGTGEIRSQWNQAEDGTVMVQLAEPAGPALQIEVEGKATAVRLPGRLNLPLVQFQGAAASETTLRVYRAPDVQLAFGTAAGWKNVEDPNLGRHQAGSGRLSAVMTRFAAGPARLQIDVSENVPVVDGIVVARLSPASSSWGLDVEARLRSSSGQLDALRLELPFAAVGPIEISPAAEHELSTLGGQTNRRLVVRPQRAVSGAFTMRLRVPLAAGADLAPIAPLIGVPDAPRVKRLVVLPRRHDDQAIEWETSGLQAIDPIGADVPEELLPAGHDVFEAVAPRPAVSVQLRSDAPAVPRVVLASHTLRAASGRQITGTTTFDVLPGGARQFALAVPANLRLVHASCAGIPAQLRRRGGGGWTIMAASSRLPQRIQLTYSGSLAGAAKPRDGHALPWLVGAEVERTGGTISGPAAPAFASPGKPGAAHEWQVTQLEGLAAALEGVSTASAGDHSSLVLQTSLSQWQERFDATYSAADLPEALASRAAAAQRRATAARERMSEAGVLPDTFASETSIPYAPVTPMAYWVGEPPQFQFDDVNGPAANTATEDRLTLAAALGSLAAAFAWLLPLPVLRSWLARHGHFVLAAAAAVWLAIGPISWLALCIAPLAVWLAIRSPWSRANADLASSILRRPGRQSR